MTDEGFGLSLNITAEPVVATNKPPKKKRLNRYDKRRLKGKRVAAACTKVEPRSHAREPKPKVAPFPTSDPSEIKPPTEAKSAKEENAAVPKEAAAPKEPLDSIEKPSPNRTADVKQVATAKAEKRIEESNSSSNAKETKKQNHSSSRKRRHDATTGEQEVAVQMDEEEQKRAQYLREFHARPLELDRRHHAQSKIKDSHASTHVFCSDGWNFHPELLRRVPFDTPTLIQKHTLEQFQSAKNLMIHAETGSGKTLAYFLPILQRLLGSVPNNQPLTRLNRSTSGTRCLVLLPTRELAVQTYDVLQKTAGPYVVAGLLIGQEKRKSEKARLRKGLTVLVATPGRFLDHLKTTVSLQQSLTQLEFLVLDEADRLLDMGLGDQIQQIVQLLPTKAWSSLLVSATLTDSIRELAQKTLKKSEWTTVQDTTSSLTISTPRQLLQYHIVVSAKWRFATLISFLIQHRTKKLVVFMSTCASVDFTHSIFHAMESILNSDDTKSTTGLFGGTTPVHKLHGNLPQAERQQVLKSLGSRSSGILLATDVAARGLDLPKLDWIIQYDPPSELSDYVHRAGRVARAGGAGHCLLFLLPSEKGFLDVLKTRSVPNNTALSLTSTLNAAAKICEGMTSKGVTRSGGGLQSGSRLGEAFATELQSQLEECVAKADSNQKKQKESELTVLARNAFLSFIRAYPVKEKALRSLFSAKALHLGHIARSFALKEAPKKLGKKGDEPKSKKPKHAPPDVVHTGKNRALLMANATKLQYNGIDSL